MSQVIPVTEQNPEDCTGGHDCEHHDDDHERGTGHAARRDPELDGLSRAGLGRERRDHRAAMGVVTCLHDPTLGAHLARRIV